MFLGGRLAVLGSRHGFAGLVDVTGPALTGGVGGGCGFGEGVGGGVLAAEEGFGFLAEGHGEVGGRWSGVDQAIQKWLPRVVASDLAVGYEIVEDGRS